MQKKDFIYTYDEEYCCYRCKYKYFKQIIDLRFYLNTFNFVQNKRAIQFYVSLKVKNKNKNDISDFEQTGKYGITPLIIAKNIILDFVEQLECLKIELPSWVSQSILGKKLYFISIRASNQKRRRVYQRLFKYGFRDYGVCLKKEFFIDYNKDRVEE